MLQDFQKTAINQFVSKVAVPILHFEGTSGGGHSSNGIGTGTLFKRDDRLFLVTARHLFDDFDPTQLAVPLKPHSSNLQTIGDLQVIKPTDEFLDVALVEFQTEAMRLAIQENWTVLTTDAVIDCPADGEFFLFGFPWATLKKSDDKIVGVPLALNTPRLKGIPKNAKKPIYANVDLFFGHSKTVKDVHGQEHQLPKLNGLSGCSVWAHQPVPEKEIWTPSKALKVVGIQSAVLEGEYIRAKAWLWAKGILDRI